MKYTLEELKEMFPGDWKKTQDNIFYLPASLPSYHSGFREISYYMYGGKIWSMPQNLYFRLFNQEDYGSHVWTSDLDKVQTYYKKHFKLQNFK